MGPWAGGRRRKAAVPASEGAASTEGGSFSSHSRVICRAEFSFLCLHTVSCRDFEKFRLSALLFRKLSFHFWHRVQRCQTGPKFGSGAEGFSTLIPRTGPGPLCQNAAGDRLLLPLHGDSAQAAIAAANPAATSPSRIPSPALAASEAAASPLVYCSQYLPAQDKVGCCLRDVVAAIVRCPTSPAAPDNRDDGLSEYTEEDGYRRIRQIISRGQKPSPGSSQSERQR